MEKVRLGLVSCYFNPCGYEALKDNFEEFLNDLGEHKERLVVANLTLDGDKEVKFDCPNQIMLYGKRPNNFLWQKEALLNVAIEQLPKEFNAVAWVDGDIWFQKKSWVEKSETLLKENQVIQLFSTCVHLNRESNIDFAREGIVSNFRSGSAWGMAWAAKRDIIEEDGLLDWIINGSGDVWMAAAWMNVRKSPQGRSPGMLRYYNKWRKRQREKVNKVGFLDEVIYHLFHGEMQNRNYGYRNRLMVKYSFDPETDLVKEENGIYAWRNPKDGLPQNLISWFYSRKEDE